jgi:hypothetical protein
MHGNSSVMCKCTGFTVTNFLASAYPVQCAVLINILLLTFANCLLLALPAMITIRIY